MSRFLDDLVILWIGDFLRHPDETDDEYLKRLRDDMGIKFGTTNPVTCKFEFSDPTEVK